MNKLYSELKLSTKKRTNMFKAISALMVIFVMFGCTEDKKGKEDKAYKDPHHHHHTPHLGVMSEFDDGFVELKLHDDKGDLELWLTTDKEGEKPFDIPLDSVVKVTFPEMENKTVELKVRDSEKNEDEDGKVNIRDKKTNYFIFPGESGADASFLKGEDFSAEVVVTFTVNGKEYKTPAFTLEPHLH